MPSDDTTGMAAWSRMPSRVVAIIPARDAAGTVAATVAGVMAIDGVDEILVVDDGSGDDTAALARAAGATVLRLPTNLGKGGAVAAGVAARPRASIYVLVDADVGATASTATVLLGRVLEGDADMAIGVLPAAGRRGGFGLVRRLAQWGIDRATGFRPEAPLSGQRAVAGELLRRLPLASRFGLETALTIDASRLGARVVEVPVTMEHAYTGRGVRGFTHRARQGADVIRALWPRLTTARVRVGVIVMALVISLVWAGWSGTQWEPHSVPLAAPPEKVVIFGMPHLRLEDLGRGATPNLERLMERGAVGAMTTRTYSTLTTAAEGYASLGAGAKVRAGREAGYAYPADARVEGSAALSVAARSTFRPVEGEVVVVAGAGVIRYRGRYVSSEPGALGEALHRAGFRTGVVNNADTPASIDGRNRVSRPAAVALMDGSLAVDVGAVARDELLVPDPTAPYGVRAGAEQVVVAAERALRTADVVLVDPGDLSRAHEFRRVALDRAVDRERVRALRRTDDILGRVVNMVGRDTLVLVVAVAPRPGGRHFTPMVAAGPGVTRGFLHSPSTKRKGLVTITDVAPTILEAMNVPVPDEMVGHALRYHPGSPELGAFRRLDRDSAHRERISFPIVLTFIVIQSVLYLGAIFAFARGGPRGGGGVLRVAVLLIAAFPLATFLLRSIPGIAVLGWASVVVLIAIDVAVTVLALRARRHVLSPLAWILGATAAVIALDVATGARLQGVSLLGYSYHTAARFFGIGNLAFAILAASTILAVCIHVQFAPRPREALITAAAVLGFVLVVEGAPSLGDDVGGILTLGPVFGLTFWVLLGRRITWRVVSAVVLGTAAVLAASVAIDLLRSPDEQTHVARFFGGEDDAWTTIGRKIATNLRVFTVSLWTWTIPFIALFVLYLLVWEGRMAELLPPRSPLRAGVVGAVAAGLLGFLLNDSGIVITAAVAIYVGPYLTLLALRREPPPPVVLDPLPTPARQSIRVGP